MKKNNLIISGAAALVAVIVVGGFATSSFAYQGNPNVEGPNHTDERHTAMTAAFEASDYEAWIAVRGDVPKGRIMDVINEDNFAQFVEMRNLRLERNIEGANAIRAELGLGQGSRGEGKGHGARSGDGEKRGGGKGMRNGGRTRGQNTGGNFVDVDGSGVCDNM